MADSAQRKLPDPYEKDADTLIEALGGSPRDAVIALLGERDYLTGRIETLEASISVGYVRLVRETKNPDV